MVKGQRNGKWGVMIGFVGLFYIKQNICKNYTYEDILKYNAA
jgi:hypothetical protein